MLLLLLFFALLLRSYRQLEPEVFRSREKDGQVSVVIAILLMKGVLLPFPEPWQSFTI